VWDEEGVMSLEEGRAPTAPLVKCLGTCPSFEPTSLPMCARNVETAGSRCGWRGWIKARVAINGQARRSRAGIVAGDEGASSTDRGSGGHVKVSAEASTGGLLSAHPPLLLVLVYFSRSSSPVSQSSSDSGAKVDVNDRGPGHGRDNGCCV